MSTLNHVQTLREELETYYSTFDPMTEPLLAKL